MEKKIPAAWILRYKSQSSVITKFAESKNSKIINLRIGNHKAQQQLAQPVDGMKVNARKFEKHKKIGIC